jgi:N-acetylglutamate synthase-like GNAT family acetyltransferase
MKIREFEKSDIGKVKDLIHRTIDVCYKKDYCDEAIVFFKEWHCDEHIFKDVRAGCMIVLEDDGKIVGTGAVNDGEIKRVFVEPALQGKGFGKLIMQKLEERAVLDGLDVVRLDASLTSRKFYDLLGYITIRKAFRNVENGKRLDYYVMEKSLKGTT